MSDKDLQQVTESLSDIGEPPSVVHSALVATGHTVQEQPNSCEQRENSKATNTGVQRFRKSLREQDCARLDVWIGGGWIRGMHSIADHQKRPFWKCIQDAIKNYVAANAKSSVAPKDRVR